MAILRNESRNQYTVVNHNILKDDRLSLKGLGLLVRLLSLPDNWNFSEKGLMAILSQDGQTSIRTGLKELERLGYLTRERKRGENGQILDVEWIIKETPTEEQKPHFENHIMDNPSLEIHPQYNINKPIIEKPIIDKSINQSEPKRKKQTAGEQKTDRIRYEEIIKDNIEYDYLIMTNDKNDIDEILNIIIDAVTSQSDTIRIAGQDKASEIVKSQLLKLNNEHIDYVLMCLKENTTKVRNIKSYLLTSLYNAPMTMGNYFTTRVRHDMANM